MLNKSMFLKPVNHNDIVKYINSVISFKLIKKLHIYLIKPLTYIINLIFKNGIVPAAFKFFIIMSIYKAGDKTLINNYRPISTISNFAKIFEKCLKERLTDFLSKNKQLLDILERSGVRGVVLQVFESYIKGRQQQVRMCDTLSDPCTVKIGIPQGTVLGPSLFNLYIRSITDLDIKGVIISYADDTVVVFDGESWEQTKQKMEYQL